MKGKGYLRSVEVSNLSENSTITDPGFNDWTKDSVINDGSEKKSQIPVCNN